MKKVHVLFTSILFILFFPVLSLQITAGSAWGATYYVDATLGNDSTAVANDINHPYKTIYKVNKLSLLPGDSVLFKRGERWREQLNCSWSGSPGLPITFGAYGTGNKPIIHAGTTLTGWVGPDVNGVYKVPYAYGLNGILEDDLSLKKATNGTLADGNWYYDNVNIYYKPTSGVPGSHTVDRLNRVGINFSTANNSYITFDSFKFIGSGFYGTSNTASLANIIIQNCDFTDAFNGIHLTAKNGHNNGPLTIQDNTFTRCGVNLYLVSIGLVTNTATIQRNTITYSNQTMGGSIWAGAGGDLDGITLINQVNSTIQNNDISGVPNGLVKVGSGIVSWVYTGIAATGNKFMYNYIHDVAGAGITNGGEDDYTSSALIAYNVIKNFGTDPFGPSGGLRISREQLPGTGSQAYNNVIVNGDISIYLNGKADNYTVKNNICYYPSLSHVVINGPLSQNVFNNNNYYPDTGSKFSWNYANYNFAGWKSSTSQDANAHSLDPDFVNPASDYSLQTISPCIGAGVYVFLTQDFLGNPVPTSSVDMGAYQLQASPTAPPPSCTYSLNRTVQSYTNKASWGTIVVTTGSNCSWTAASNVSWITITAGTSGIGSGQVNYTIAANPTGADRHGIITVAGIQYAVNQWK